MRDRTPLSLVASDGLFSVFKSRVVVSGKVGTEDIFWESHVNCHRISAPICGVSLPSRNLILDVVVEALCHPQPAGTWLFLVWSWLEVKLWARSSRFNWFPVKMGIYPWKMFSIIQSPARNVYVFANVPKFDFLPPVLCKCNEMSYSLLPHGWQPHWDLEWTNATSIWCVGQEMR